VCVGRGSFWVVCVRCVWGCRGVGVFGVFVCMCVCGCVCLCLCDVWCVCVWMCFCLCVYAFVCVCMCVCVCVCGVCGVCVCVSDIIKRRTERCRGDWTLGEQSNRMKKFVSWMLDIVAAQQTALRLSHCRH